MKIVIFTDSFLPRVCGVTNSIFYLVQGLVKNGAQVMIVAPQKQGYKKIHIPGVELVYVKSFPLIFYPDFRLGLLTPNLVKKLRAFKPDIVHTASPGPLGLVGSIYGKISHKALVCVFHTYIAEDEFLKLIGIKTGADNLKKIFWKFTKEYYDNCDIVITPSIYVGKDLKRQGIKNKIIAINNPIKVSNNIDLKKQQDFIKRYKLKDKKIALYSGRLSKEKSLDDLLNIFKDIINLDSSVRLILAGDGPIKKDLEKLAKELKINKNVIFTGQIPHKDLINWGVYDLADVGVSASNSEVQPMSFIEAMTFGLPIVALKSRGLGELISRNGFLVKQGDNKGFVSKIFKILNNKDLSAKMGEKARQKAKDYNYLKVAEKHLDLYQKILNKKS
jgi:1,2-diacylglycerol 3-alpha-glucosyltransferase